MAYFGKKLTSLAWNAEPRNTESNIELRAGNYVSGATLDGSPDYTLHILGRGLAGAAVDLAPLVAAGTKYLTTMSYTPSTYKITGTMSDASTVVLGDALTNFGNTIYLSGSNAGFLRLYEPTSAGSEFIKLQAPVALTSSLIFTLPDAYPVDTTDKYLTASTLGVMSWEAAAAGGGTIAGSITDNQVAIGATTANSIEGSSDFTWDGSKLLVEGDIELGSSSDLLIFPGRTQVNANGGLLVVEDLFGNDAYLVLKQPTASRNIGMKFNSTGNSKADITYHADGDPRLVIDCNHVITFEDNGTEKLRLNDGSLFMTEKSEAQSDMTAYGQIWVKNDTPNQLYYTDDAGTDYNLLTAGGGTIGGSIADNYIAIGDATNEIDSFVLGLAENSSIWIGSDPANTDTASSNTALGMNTLDSLTTGDSNTGVGRNAGTAVTTGEMNCFVGQSAGLEATESSYNNFFGYAAGYSGTRGNQNNAFGYYAMSIQQGTNNVAMGHNAMQGEAGSDNDACVGIGAYALRNLSGTANDNVAVGYGALQGPGTGSTGNDNTAVGRSAGDGVSTGAYNTFIGGHAGNSVTTATDNAMLGYKAGYTVTGSHNVIIGSAAAVASTGLNASTVIGRQALGGGVATAEAGIAIGIYAGYALTSGYENTIIGQYAGKSGTGMNNTVLIGRQAGEDNTASSSHFVGFKAGVENTSGAGNMAEGYEALKTNTTGAYNTAIGYRSLYSNVDGGHNVALGYQTLYEQTDTNKNVAIGKWAGARLDGDSNVLIGYQAGSQEPAAGTANTAANNTIIGYQAAIGTTTGGQNVFLGYSAAGAITTGEYNVGIGYGVGPKVDGDSNVAIGRAAAAAVTGNYNVIVGENAGTAAVGIDHCVLIGREAGASAMTGDHNVYLGSSAGYSSIGANANVYIGKSAGRSAVEVQESVAIGYEAAYNHVSGLTVAIGYSAGKDMTTGSNTLIGYAAGENLTTGTYNTIVGMQALDAATTGDRNTAVGRAALGALTTGAYNTAVGYGAMINATSAVDTVAVGYFALEELTSGVKNTALGYVALQANTTGNYNTAFGNAAMQKNVHGDGNTAVGYQALQESVAGDGLGYNVALGYQALDELTTGVQNVGIGGSYVMASMVTGNYNVGLGYGVLEDATKDNNTAIGHQAGANTTTGTGNVFLGYRAGYTPTTDSNKLFIHNDSGTALIGGDFSTPSLTFNADDVTITSAASEKPFLLIENTNADSVPPVLRLFKNTTSPADADRLGQIDFAGKEETSGDTKVYFQLLGRSNDVTDTTANGQLDFYGLDGDSPGFLKQFGMINSQFSVHNSDGIGPTLTITGTQGGLLKSAGTKFKLQAGSSSNGEFLVMCDYFGINTTGPSKQLHVVGDSLLDGDVTVSGTLSATAKSFNIPHPLYKDKRLVHGSLEGPEHGLYIRGTIEAIEGCLIELPEYWEAMCEDYTVQLTPHGPYTVFIKEKQKDRVMVDSSSKDYKFDYYIVGARTDVTLEVVQDG